MGHINKIWVIFVSTVLVSGHLAASMSSAPQEQKSLQKVIDFQGEMIAKGATISVTNAGELSTAILAAATDDTESTVIKIFGVIIGNFTIPATVHSIDLVGATPDAAINANGTGTALTINLGATVNIKDLLITGAAGTGRSGIINNGELKVVNSSITNNGPDAGISNFNRLFVNASNINNNNGYGVYTQTGGISRIYNSSINSNSSTGLYTYSGRIVVRNSTVNLNGAGGFYNYYGTRAFVKNSEVNQNIGYGIENVYASLATIKNSSISNNSLYGIYNEGTVSRIFRSTISGNTSGVYNYQYAVANIFDSEISGNTASGIYNTDVASLFVHDSRFHNNSTTANGGAIFNDGSSSVSVFDSTFEANSALNGGSIYNDNAFSVDRIHVTSSSATNNGGGLYNAEDASLIIRDSKVEDNTAANDGGGFYNEGTETVIDTKVLRNTAIRGGGLANITTGSLWIVLSEVERNIATFGFGGGGGIYSTGVSLTVQDTVVAHNTPDQIVE